MRRNRKSRATERRAEARNKSKTADERSRGRTPTKRERAREESAGGPLDKKTRRHEARPS
jgi:hypothetical protein